MPKPDDIDRDKFYTSDVDDDPDLELEPPDAEVIAAEERRAKETIEATMMSVDIDEVYRDSERRRNDEILDTWARGLKFRFQVKHLLIVMAVLAIALTLWRLGLLFSTLAMVFMISVCAAYCYVLWMEKKHQDEAERRRKEMYARQRAYFENRGRGPARNDEKVPAAGSAVGSATATNDEESAGDLATRRQKPVFQFSLRQLLTAMFGAAIILGFVQFLGGAAPTATFLGMVILAGLVIHATGYEPPDIVILGWWLMLVLYVILSIVAAMWNGIT